MQRQFPLDIEALDDIYRFIARFVDAAELDEQLHFQIDLVVEELFTNMIKYDNKKEGRVHLNLEKKEDNLVIIITDYNVQRFNPNETDLYDTSSDLDTRPVGKIGIHLIKKMIDEIDYTYKDHNSIITLTKHIGSSHV